MTGIMQMLIGGSKKAPDPPDGTRGLFAGGAFVNVIDFIEIPSLGNGSDFGDLPNLVYGLSGVGSSTRGVFIGGEQDDGGSTSFTNTMSYVTIASAGNASDFGDLTGNNLAFGAACGNATRGCFAGGYAPPFTLTNTIQYITIASAGNSTDFGDLLSATGAIYAGSASTTRGLFAGGEITGNVYINVIQYITIASTGNTTDFGDLIIGVQQQDGSASNSTRALFFGGWDGVAPTINVISYVTIATTGNATDFGDLLDPSRLGTAVSNTTRAVVQVGSQLQYVTIATTGNSIYFGDLTVSKTSRGACSNAHGGI
jgi:hypothetical protein